MLKTILIITGAFMMTAGCSGTDASDESRMAAEQEPSDAAGIEAEPAAEGLNLAAVLDFKNAANCEWGDAADKIFETQVVFGDGGALRPGRVTISGIAEPVTAKLSRPEREYPDYVEAQLDFTGEWKGLQVVGLTDAFFEESGGVFARGIRFAAPVAEVASILAAAGFNVNADGSERSLPLRGPDFSDGDEVVTAIETNGSETVFFCNQVFEGI